MGMVELNLDPTARQLRVFGVAFLIFSVIVGIALWMQSGDLPKALLTWAVLSVTAVGSMVLPRWGRFLYALTTLISFPIGWVLSFLIMGVIYYLVLTPIGLLLRLAGRDALRLRKRDEVSCWSDRPPAGEPSQYFRQY